MLMYVLEYQVEEILKEIYPGRGFLEEGLA